MALTGRGRRLGFSRSVGDVCAADSPGAVAPAAEVAFSGSDWGSLSRSNLWPSLCSVPGSGPCGRWCWRWRCCSCSCSCSSSRSRSRSSSFSCSLLISGWYSGRGVEAALRDVQLGLDLPVSRSLRWPRGECPRKTRISSLVELLRASLALVFSSSLATFFPSSGDAIAAPAPLLWPLAPVPATLGSPVAWAASPPPASPPGSGLLSSRVEAVALFWRSRDFRFLKNDSEGIFSRRAAPRGSGRRWPNS